MFRLGLEDRPRNRQLLFHRSNNLIPQRYLKHFQILRVQESEQSVDSNDAVIVRITRTVMARI